MPKRYDNSRVLVISDTHYPYEKKGTNEFIKMIIDEYEPDRVVHGGDILDVYSVSSYPTDPDHPDSWSDEIKKARDRVAELASIIPKMEIMESNHDDRAYKKSRLAGIPREYLIPFKDIIGAPDGWKWHRDLTLRCEKTRDYMYFAHTKTGGSLSCAKERQMTTVIGHHHSRFGATAFKAHKKIVWGVDAGCFVSDKGSPFKYNKGDRGRPIQGCCILIDGVPNMIPFV